MYPSPAFTVLNTPLLRDQPLLKCDIDCVGYYRATESDMCLVVLLIPFVMFLSCFSALFEQIKCMYVKSRYRFLYALLDIL